MRLVSKAVLSAAVGAGALVLSVAGASAAVVCAGNVCWHTHETFEYPPDARIVVHPDDWHWGRNEHFVFREHEGRGYWRGGRWTELR